MLEGQHFEPTGRLAQFIRVLSDFERDEIEAAVDGLIQLLDERDGDADQENATGLEDAFEGHGRWFGPGCPVSDEGAAIFHRDPWDRPGDEGDAEPSAWSEGVQQHDDMGRAGMGMVKVEDMEEDDPSGDGNPDQEGVTWAEHGEGRQPETMSGGVYASSMEQAQAAAYRERVEVARSRPIRPVVMPRLPRRRLAGRTSNVVAFVR